MRDAQKNNSTAVSPWTPPDVGVYSAAADETTQARVRALAESLGLRITDCDDTSCDLLLVVTDAGLQLRERGSGSAIQADFGESTESVRRLATASRRQPLARAVGFKRGTPSVVDATAGLGRDAMFLASLGCSVTAIERSAILAAMLRDAQHRAARAAELDGTEPTRFELLVGDAAKLIESMPPEQAPDMIYLDPMYAPSGKSALPKKEMRILRRLLGDDTDAGELLEVARRVAGNRVVVKRPPHAAPLAEEPSMSIRGKLVRYDVYLIDV